jgi:hypothetical protein
MGLYRQMDRDDGKIAVARFNPQRKRFIDVTAYSAYANPMRSPIVESDG